jgi:hypothetical protein
LGGFLRHFWVPRSEAGSQRPKIGDQKSEKIV